MAHDKDGNVVRKGGASNGNGGQRSKYRNSVGDGPIRWDVAEALLLLATVDAVTEAGDALVLARSSDGGVLSITVCSGPQRIKYYAKSGAEVNKHLHEICTDAGGSPDAL